MREDDDKIQWDEVLSAIAALVLIALLFAFGALIVEFVRQVF